MDAQASMQRQYDASVLEAKLGLLICSTGSGFNVVEGSRFRAQGFGFGVQGLRFGGRGLRFGILALGCKIQGLESWFLDLGWEGHRDLKSIEWGLFRPGFCREHAGLLSVPIHFKPLEGMP